MYEINSSGWKMPFPSSEILVEQVSKSPDNRVDYETVER